MATSGKPETSIATPLLWNNYTLVDTPGLGSGNKTHDEETLKWLVDADLLIYMLTPDLFTNFAGRRFHDILNKYNRKQELMLVMNMIDQEGNDIDVYREELQGAIDPTPLADYFPTFISAEYYLRSEESSENEDKEYYLSKSNFSTFIETLDKFLLNKEQKSRLTTPITKLYALSQAIEFKSDFNKEVELLSIKIQFFNETSRTINTIIDDFESGLDADVLKTSGGIYSALDNPPKDFKKFIKDEFKDFNNSMISRIDYLTEQTNLILEDFENENIEIDNSNLSKEVENRINKSSKLKEIFEKSTSLNINNKSLEQTMSFDDLKLKAKEFDDKFEGSNLVTNMVTGNFKELSTQLISKIDKKMVLDIGHKLGHKFKPWEAVKLTGKISKNISKSVPFINIGVAIWEVGSHYYRKNKEAKSERNLREFKESIRDNLNNAKLETIQAVRGDMLNPIIENFNLLNKIHNDKKNELMKFSISNESLVKELEQNRQLCLEIHDEVYK